jgi:hypothetical protein
MLTVTISKRWHAELSDQISEILLRKSSVHSVDSLSCPRQKHHVNVSQRLCPLDISELASLDILPLDHGHRHQCDGLCLHVLYKKQKHLFLRVFDVFFPHSCHDVCSCRPCWWLYRQVLWRLPASSFLSVLSFGSSRIAMAIASPPASRASEHGMLAKQGVCILTASSATCF